MWKIIKCLKLQVEFLIFEQWRMYISVSLMLCIKLIIYVNIGATSPSAKLWAWVVGDPQMAQQAPEKLKPLKTWEKLLASMWWSSTVQIRWTIGDLDASTKVCSRNFKMHSYVQNNW